VAVGYKNNYKRILDIIFACLGLIFIFPLIIIISIPLLISNNGKIFFFQQRAGLRGKIFNLVKLRTMKEKKDCTGKPLPDNERLSKMGIFIRSVSVDELPQLLNILKGDMSFVGPRPLLADYLPLYNSIQSRRHEIRPGLTGWAQINGRNNMSWEEKFELDVWYVDNVSFLLDIKILLKTILVVLKRTGVSSANSATMERFRGSKKV
jgi:lipopolysaccharide/colanic/teichoic acid biosynthesis glycosyltransferase